MKTILTIIICIFISAGVIAGELKFDSSGKPAPKKEAKASKRSLHKPKKAATAEVTGYLMDNGEYYVPKRQPKINYHYHKTGQKNKNRR